MKLIIAAVLIIFVGLVTTAVVAPNYMNWEKHSDFLEQKIAGMAGMPGAKISGPITIKTLPTPRIEIGRIEIASFQGEKKIAVVEDFATELSWRALLRLSLQPKYIRASSVEVNLVKMADGEANYLPKRHSRRISANAPRSLYPLGAFGDTQLENITVHYENQPKGTAHTLTTDELTMTSPTLSQTSVNVAGMLNDAPFTINGDLDLSSLRQMPVDIGVTLAKSRLQLQGTAFDPFYKPMYNGQIKATIANLAAPFEALGLEIPAFIKNNKKFANISFQSKVMLDGDELAFNDINLLSNVPENGEETRREKIEGHVNYKYATSTDPADMRINLKGRNIHMGALLASEETGDSKEPEGWSEAPFDLSFLKTTTFDFRFDGQSIVYGNSDFDTLAFRLVNSNSTLTLEELTAETAGGTARLSGMYGHASANPELKAKIRIRNMPLQSLITGSLANRITGEMTGRFDLSSRGADEKALVSNLNGEGEIHITEGALLGMKLKDTVTAVKKLFKRNESHEQTDFSNMSLTFTVEDGTVRNEDFYLHSEKAALKASGKVDLVSWTINVRVRPQLETGLVELLVPVQISGPLSGPAIVPVVTKSTGKGAAIGALLGGPVGAAIGAMVGSKVSKDNKSPEAPAEPLTDEQVKDLEDKVEEELGTPLPFKLDEATPEDVRKFLNEQQ